MPNKVTKNSITNSLKRNKDHLHKSHASGLNGAKSR